MMNDERRHEERNLHWEVHLTYELSVEGVKFVLF